MRVVRIGFQRVQTFLFAVPRLRHMVGANVLLGETLRLHLPALARSYGCGLGGLTVPSSAPAARDDDPLAAAPGADRDDPAADMAAGILARDGGHFIALFPDAGRADAFVAAAEAMLAERLPGLGVSVAVAPFPDGLADPAPRMGVERPVDDLPQFQVCTVSGNGPAVGADRREDGAFVSAPVRQRADAYDRFRSDAGSRDVIGLMRDALPAFAPAEDFAAMCAGDYLALIHADGNRIGDRSVKARGRDVVGETPTDRLAREARGGRFFHSARVAVRRAVATAVGAAFPTPAEGEGRRSDFVRPFQLLMLGGDDLVMVCRAKAALPFAVEYARAIAAEPLEDGGDRRPGTVGIGIAIASPSMPFHHLHRIAERLVDSAKRRVRGRPEAEIRSTVDWMVTTGSWADDPVAERRRDAMVAYGHGEAARTLILTRRPLPVLAEADGDPLGSLEGLLAAAARMRVGRPAARSQLRRLSEELRRGEHHAELAFRELPADTRAAVERIGVAGPWMAGQNGFRVTGLIDLIETMEIATLGHVDRTPREAA